MIESWQQRAVLRTEGCVAREGERERKRHKRRSQGPTAADFAQPQRQAPGRNTAAQQLMVEARARQGYLSLPLITARRLGTLPRQLSSPVPSGTPGATQIVVEAWLGQTHCATPSSLLLCTTIGRSCQLG